MGFFDEVKHMVGAGWPTVTAPPMVLCSLALLSACADASGVSSSAASSATPPSTGSTQTRNAQTADVDAKVADALKKVAACPMDGAQVKSDCAAIDAVRDVISDYANEDDLNLTKKKKLVASCSSLWGDANAAVRTAALDCVQGNTDGLTDPKAVVAELSKRVETETNTSAQGAMFQLLDELDPTKLGATSEVIALAKKLTDRSDAWPLGELLRALTPKTPGAEPTDEAYALALDLITVKERAQDLAIPLIARKKSKAQEVCPALGNVVASNPNLWMTATTGIITLGGCAQENDKVIARVAATTAKKDFALGLAHLDTIQRFVTTATLSPEQKTRLRAALEAAVKAITEPSLKTRGDKLLKSLA